MFKRALVVIILGLLSGCASSQRASSDLSDVNKEKMFVEANNYEQLIEFYKNELKQQESAESRLKLGQAYLDHGDAESAVFVVSQLSQSDHSSQSELILAKSFFALGQHEEAKKHVENVLTLDDANGEAYNLLGVILATQGEISLAEEKFIQARRQFYLDSVVKNNLATIYLIQQQYQKSYQLLSSVYQTNPDDETTRANLIVTLIKLDRVDEARELLAADYKAEQVSAIIKFIGDQEVSSFSVPNTLEVQHDIE